MPEVTVEKQQKQQLPVGREKPGMSVFNDLFTPMFPASRLFGVRPFALMREFTDEMDRMFRGTPAAPEAWAPAVDIQRCNGDLVVTAELPGMKKDEVKVEMTDDALIIQGERKREHKEDHEGYHRFERSYGKFYRAIPLPEGVKVDMAKAELNEGILKISMPAPQAEKKAHSVPIQEGSARKAA
jgi:HSP20 family protein